MRPVQYLGIAVFVALIVLIAIVFDSPTSVFLLVGMSLVALGLSYSIVAQPLRRGARGVRRRSRQPHS